MSGSPSWARVGAKVVCIAQVKGMGPEALPVVGATYTIREVIHFSYGVGIRLVEIRNPPLVYLDGSAEASFTIRGFRPVITIDDDLKAHFAHLLDAPVRVTEEA